MWPFLANASVYSWLGLLLWPPLAISKPLVLGKNIMDPHFDMLFILFKGSFFLTPLLSHATFRNGHFRKNPASMYLLYLLDTQILLLLTAIWIQYVFLSSFKILELNSEWNEIFETHCKRSCSWTDHLQYWSEQRSLKKCLIAKCTLGDEDANMVPRDG